MTDTTTLWLLVMVLSLIAGGALGFIEGFKAGRKDMLKTVDVVLSNVIEEAEAEEDDRPTAKPT